MRPGRGAAQKLANETGQTVVLWRQGERMIVQLCGVLVPNAELLEKVQPNEGTDIHVSSPTLHSILTTR